MRISVAADERTGVAEAVVDELRRRGHEPLAARRAAPTASATTGPGPARRPPATWPRAAPSRAIVCCWTGTGASIAANKVAGVRAALCADAETARGARRWNDANVLALSLRTTSEALLEEILDGWFEAAPSEDADDVANIRHVDEIG